MDYNENLTTAQAPTAEWHASMAAEWQGEGCFRDSVSLAIPRSEAAILRAARRLRKPRNWRAYRKIPLIREVRQRYGLGLYEAKCVVELWQDGVVRRASA